MGVVPRQEFPRGGGLEQREQPPEHELEPLDLPPVLEVGLLVPQPSADPRTADAEDARHLGLTAQVLLHGSELLFQGNRHSIRLRHPRPPPTPRSQSTATDLVAGVRSMMSGNRSGGGSALRD